MQGSSPHRASGARFGDPAQKLGSRIQDFLLNISTCGTAAIDRPGAVYYATIAYPVIRDVLRRLDLGPSDIFVDVGCGKGRVLCLAAQHQMTRVIGVEYSAELARMARENARRVRHRRTPVEVAAMPAEEFDYSSATALYFFNPFEAEILDVVLAKIHVDRGTRPLRLAFVMESPAQEAVFQKHTWLQRADTWLSSAGHPCSLYTNAFTSQHVPRDLQA